MNTRHSRSVWQHRVSGTLTQNAYDFDYDYEYECEYDSNSDYDSASDWLSFIFERFRG